MSHRTGTSAKSRNGFSVNPAAPVPAVLPTLNQGRRRAHYTKVEVGTMATTNTGRNRRLAMPCHAGL